MATTTFSSTVMLQREPVSAASPATALDRIAFATLCAFVFAVPWEESVPLLGGFVIGRWLGLLALGTVLLRVLAAGQYRKLSSLHGWMAGLVAWNALSIFWTMDRDSTAMRIGTYLQLLAAVWLIWELAGTATRLEKLLQSYVFGTCVLAVSTLFNYSMGYTASDASTDSGVTRWHDSRYTAAGVNENDLGLMLALSIPMVLYLLTGRRKPLMGLLLWMQLGLSFMALFLSGSRGGLLSALVSLTMLPLVASALPRWQRLAVAVMCVAGVAGGIYLLPVDTWHRILNFTTEVADGTMTHRTVIWAAGLDAFRQNALAGVGAGAYAAAVLRAVDIPYPAHNTFLSVLVELGVIGALLFFGLLASLLYAIRRMRYLDKCLWIVLLLTWATGVSALTWEYHKPTWFLFGMAAAHVYARKTGKRGALR